MPQTVSAPGGFYFWVEAQRGCLRDCAGSDFHSRIGPGGPSVQVQSPGAPPSGPCANVPSLSPYSASLAPVRNETRLSNGTLVNNTYYPIFFLKPNSSGIFCYTYSVSSGKTTLNLVAGKNYLTGTYGIHGSFHSMGMSLASQPNLRPSPCSMEETRPSPMR